MSTMEITKKINSLNFPLEIDGDNMEKEILKPCTYLISVPGKRIRQDLVKVMNYWLPITDDQFKNIDDVIFYAHNASLLVDDIQDFSVLRRGTPSAHTVYGIPKTYLAANWAMAIVNDLLWSIVDLSLLKECVAMCQKIIAGQGMDIYWRENNICPTEPEYLEMAFRKTTILFLLTTKLMNALTTGKRLNVDRLMKSLGLYFQINDDYQNLCSEYYFDSKGFCEDLTEGKFGFPVVHAVNNFPEEGKIIKEIIAQRTYDIATKKYCLSLIRKCGSFEYTRKKLEELRTIISKETAKLDPNPLLEEFIEKAMQLSL